MKRVFEELRMSVLPWPGNSPDLNPIENLWHCLKRKVHQMKPTTERQLMEAVVHCWNHEISGELVTSLVDSMPARIKQVIRAKGGVTKY
jgi:transposase